MRKLLLAISVIAVISSCTPCPPPALLTPVQGGTPVTCTATSSCIVALWIAADRDTFISSDQQNTSFGCERFLTVAGSNPPTKRVYVHFLLPTLPAGKEILDAKIELYHSGEREDGKTDDLNIPFGGVVFNWIPYNLTWNNEPNPPTAQVMMIHLRSKDWSGSRASDARQIIDLLGNALATPGATTNGFVLDYPNNSPSIEKGFVSDNDPGRTATNLYLAPRLLLKVRLPPGTSTNNITLPSTLPMGTDLYFRNSPTILMLRHEPAPAGSLWPTAWNVSPPS